MVTGTHRTLQAPISGFYNPSDVADAICDSQAIVEAIQSNAWADVADMVRSRVELKAERLAHLAGQRAGQGEQGRLDGSRGDTARPARQGEEGNTSAGRTIFSENSTQFGKNVKLLLEHEMSKPINI